MFSENMKSDAFKGSVFYVLEMLLHFTVCLYLLMQVKDELRGQVAGTSRDLHIV